MAIRVLLVEDDAAFVAELRERVVAPLGALAEFTFAADLAAARAALGAAPCDLLLLDIAFPLVAGGDLEPRAGIKLLAELPGLAPGARVIVLSGQDRASAVKLLLSRKVDGYLFKDSGYDEVRIHVEQALERIRLERANQALRQAAAAGRALVTGASAAMASLLQRARQVAVRETTVLVTGESGTGKELVARLVHEESPRRDGPFVALSCGALPEGLVEAELFGAAKGAYTGLDRPREGAMAAARGGTLFLDEVGELPLAVQPKLLRALQERTFRPLGATREEKADFRLVCATHRELATMAKQGRFREDLLFRIQVFPLELPPLRQRMEDLPQLLEHLVARFNREMGRRIEGFEPDALARLRTHSWPGNVRELVNVVEYAFVVETGVRIGPASLPGWAAGSAPRPEPGSRLGHRQALEAFERSYLEAALADAGMHLGRTAEAVGLPKRTLQDRMAKLGIRIRERG